jgi:hypothetical protein
MKKTAWILVGYLLICTVPAAAEDSADDDSDIQVQYVQKTRFGDLSLVSIDAMPADTIMFKEKKVFADPVMHVGILDTIQLMDSDVTLVESNPGGSATPASQMSLLLIRKDGSVQILSHPEFTAADGMFPQATMDIEKRIFIKLGFPIEVGPNRGKTEPIAIFDSGKLSIVHLTRIHGEYRPGGARVIDEYFADDKWVALRKEFYSADHSLRVEYFCDDKESVEKRGADEAALPHILCAAAVFVKQSNQWIFSEQFEMPYGGTVKSFTGNLLVVETNEYLDNDGFAYPSTRVTRTFKTGSGKLVENVAARKSIVVHSE